MDTNSLNIEDRQTDQIAIVDDSTMLNVESIARLLKQTSWARERSLETIEISLKNSICFGAFCDGEQVGFARVVSDRCTFAYLCDVIVDEKFRGRGISKLLMNRIMSHPELQQFRLFLLATTNAHGLYGKFGFVPSSEKSFMQILREGI